jgi:TonB family protein
MLRVSRMVVVTFMAGLLLARPASAQQSAAPKWRLSSTSQLCMLWRSYGPNGSVARLGIKPSLTGDFTRLFIIYPAAEDVNHWGKGAISVTGGANIPVEFIDFPSTEPGKRFVQMDVPAATVAPALRAPAWKFFGERMKASPTWKVEEVRLPEFEFALDGLSETLPALEQCVADHLKRLSLDEAGRARIAQPPEGDLSRYVSDRDYPLFMASLGISGSTRARLLVGADGNVIDCYVNESSGNGALDYMTCATLARAKFKAARDTSGRPVAGDVTQTISWRVAEEHKAKPR